MDCKTITVYCLRPVYTHKSLSTYQLLNINLRRYVYRQQIHAVSFLNVRETNTVPQFLANLNDVILLPHIIHTLLDSRCRVTFFDRRKKWISSWFYLCCCGLLYRVWMIKLSDTLMSYKLCNVFWNYNYKGW